MGQSHSPEKAQGDWDIWYLLCNRDWPPAHMAREYARRIGCEQGCRDTKYCRGFARARIADIRAWSRFFALFVLALLLLVMLGTACWQRAPAQLPQRLRQVLSRRRGRWELSLVNAIRKLLQRDLDLFTWLQHFTWFDLDDALPNVS